MSDNDSVAQTPAERMPAAICSDRAPGTPVPKAPIWRGGFLAAALILGVAALGLNVAVSKLQLHFRKEPVPMRAEFKQTMPAVIGDWVQVARDENLTPEMLAALETDQFLFCYYVNAKRLKLTPQSLFDELQGRSLDEQRARMREYTRQNPAAVLAVALTYYTGKADTVAHVPERCYVGDGFTPLNPERVHWGLGRDLDVQYTTFEGESGAPRHVAYFFHVNGRYHSDSLAVRNLLQDLIARHAYYSKVELMCMTSNRNDAAQAMKEFLGEGLVHVEQALPDWSQYRGR